MVGIYLKDGRFYESPVHTVHSLEAVGAGDAFAGALNSQPGTRVLPSEAHRLLHHSQRHEADDPA